MIPNPIRTAATGIYSNGATEDVTGGRNIALANREVICSSNQHGLRKCPVCSRATTDVRISVDGLDILSCKDCLVFFSRAIVKDDTYYRDEFGSERHRLGQVINGVINSALLQKFHPIAPGMAILDIGCGYGYFLRNCKAHGHRETFGFEISLQERDYAASVNCVKLLENDVYGKLESQFDYVTCFEVIEHLTCPMDLVNDIRRLLKPNGTAVIMTDNFGSSIIRNWDIDFPKWIPHSHVTHFTPQSLISLLELGGFRVKLVFSYSPWELIFLKIFTVLFGRLGSVDRNNVGKEFNASFRGYPLRRLLSPIWARLTAKRSSDGALIYIVVEKPSY